MASATMRRRSVREIGRIPLFGVGLKRQVIG
jgi:hypothetical protein